MTPIHSLIAITLQQARLPVCLLLIISFLNNGYAQELTSAASQEHPELQPFQFEPSFQPAEMSRGNGSFIGDEFADRSFQPYPIFDKSSMESNLYALSYHSKPILFSPSLHLQQSPLKASGSRRLYKFLTAAAFTALGAYFLATSKSEQVFRNDGFFSIYRVTPEGRTCIENCPYWQTERDWKFGAGIASIGAAAGFLYWGIESD